MSARRWSVDLDLRLNRLYEALALRDEWLSAATTTSPADRDTAESVISRLYELVGARAPAFVWVKSPAAATESVAAHGELAATAVIRHTDMPAQLTDWPVAHRLADAAGTLRHAFDHVAAPRRLTYDPVLADHVRLLAEVEPAEAVRRQVPLRVVIEAVIQTRLLNSVEDSIRLPIHDELQTRAGPPRCLAWYGQHDVWPAVLDIHHRLRLIHPSPEQEEQLNLWTALGRSCGWWWPLDRACVLAERPMLVRTEQRAGPDHAGERLHGDDGPAVAFPDGWRVYSWHGTRVPEWVITDPSPDRVARESNVEIRRCAIERIGWDRFVEQADLHLLGTARDPGNRDCVLRLYQVPGAAWGTGVRLLVATNGSVERDGSRRTYGLTVPAHIDHPLTAAAWTYGLPAYIYARLARRT